MNHWQSDVRKFSRATGGGTLATEEGRELRAKLIMEEAVETVAALGFDVAAVIEKYGVPGVRPHKEVARFSKSYDDFHLADFIDGVCDTIYVTVGGIVNLGISLDPYWDEVQRANMDKLAGPKREDGKQLKPEGWVGPRHDVILAKYGDSTVSKHRSDTLGPCLACAGVTEREHGTA
jgi:predicted HAD superfamily Cof-like phosphohydrolase